MFPIWDIPWWVAVAGQFQPVLNSIGTGMVYVLVVAAIIIQLGVIAFGAYTINEAIQKSE